MTSRHVLNRLQRLLDQRKIGHGGTLDPFATGVLLVLLGSATRLNQHLEGLPKSYRATLKLGAETATLDKEGEVVEERPVPPATDDEVASAITFFVGEYTHEIPAYSAVHIGGRRLYDLAREGKAPEKAPVRTTHIHGARLVERPEDDTIIFDATVSSGTYIRSLGRDIARHLGTVGSLSALERRGIGPFGLEDCCTWEDVESIDKIEARYKIWERNCATALPCPPVWVDAEAEQRLRNGLPHRFERSVDLPPCGEKVKMVNADQRLVGIGMMQETPLGLEVKPVTIVGYALE